MPANAVALRPSALKNYSNQQDTESLERRLGASVIQHRQNYIKYIEEETDAKTKAQLIADYIKSDMNIQQVLLKRKAHLTDIFTNVMYRLDFNKGPKIAISMKEGKIASVVKQQVYEFSNIGNLALSQISHSKFLNLELTGPSGDILTVEEFFKKEGVFDSVKEGLPSELAGAAYYNESDEMIFVPMHFSSGERNVIAIDFNEKGLRARSSVIDNKPAVFQGRRPFLEFHFHPDEDVIPSPRDMLTILANKIPMLILSPTGKGKVWVVLDEKELAIRLKPYINKTDIHARKFPEKAVKEGWIFGVEVDLFAGARKTRPVFKEEHFIRKIDSAA